MELIAYLFVIGLNLNIIGAGVLFLELIRLEISEVFNSVRRSSKTKRNINRKKD